MAADFFVVPTVTFRLRFVLVVLADDRRRIVHVAVTDHPTAAWTAQQLRNAFPDDQAPDIWCTIAMAPLPRWPPAIAHINLRAHLATPSVTFAIGARAVSMGSRKTARPGLAAIPFRLAHPAPQRFILAD